MRRVRRRACPVGRVLWGVSCGGVSCGGVSNEACPRGRVLRGRVRGGVSSGVCHSPTGHVQQSITNKTYPKGHI